MGTKILLLFCMVFCHIVDDYYLQGWLASAKQKSWWQKNSPDKLYKNDYKMALFMHSFSWAFMSTLPLTIYTVVMGGMWYWFLILFNVGLHYWIDDLKANQKKINLVEDQIFHMIQIFLTWAMWFFVFS